MPIPVDSDGFAMSLVSRLCESVVAALKADATLAAYTAGRIYRYEPDTLDDYFVARTIFVYAVPESELLNLMPANFAMPRYAVAIVLVDAAESEPLAAGAISSADRREHIEAVLARGTVAGDGTTGRYICPYSVPGDPPTTRFVTELRPSFQKRPSRVIPLNGDDVQSGYLTTWPLLALFGSQVNSVTRSRA